MYQVILALPDSSMGGVTTFSINLARGLVARGIPAHILLTETETDCVQVAEPQVSLPSDVQVERLPVERRAGWSAHWLAMKNYLEQRAPCIYIPNHNYRHSCISPKLSRRVAVVGVVHTDDELNYDHAERLGRYWNAIVATSPHIAQEIETRAPSLARRLETIPIGVPIPSEPTRRQSSPDTPLRLIYHGRLVQYQKRVLDLAAIAATLHARRIPFHMTIAGNGSDQENLKAACAPFIASGKVDFLGYVDQTRIAELLRGQDIFLLTSDYEGMPNALLEAMGYGCVPIVTNVRSGIPSVVRDGENGYCVPVGAIDAFVERINTLYRSSGLRAAMSERARSAVIEGRYDLEKMIEQYIALFKHVEHDARWRIYRRPRGPLMPPPEAVGGVSILPGNYLIETERTELALSRTRYFRAVLSGRWGVLEAKLRKLAALPMRRVNR